MDHCKTIYIQLLEYDYWCIKLSIRNGRIGANEEEKILLEFLT